MQYKFFSQVMRETKLSPEKLASRFCISNLTYRRWLKRPGSDEIPAEYTRTIAGGIYRLLGEGLLDHNSRIVSKFLTSHLPEFFSAVISQFKLPDNFFSAGGANQQKKITRALSCIGQNADIRRQVESEATAIGKFTRLGEDWKTRVSLLSRVVRSKSFAPADKFVAFGALFYLLMPFDLIPDQIPVFGYVDDFGILGFAAAHYVAKFPALCGLSPRRKEDP